MFWNRCKHKWIVVGCQPIAVWEYRGSMPVDAYTRVTDKCEQCGKYKQYKLKGFPFGEGKKDDHK